MFFCVCYGNVFGGVQNDCCQFVVFVFQFVIGGFYIGGYQIEVVCYVVEFVVVVYGDVMFQIVFVYLVYCLGDGFDGCYYCLVYQVVVEQYGDYQ